MSRLYCMDRDQAEVIAMLQRSEVPGLQHVHKPTEDDGTPAIWTDGVTDGENYGWFEDNLLEFFGQNNEDPILRKLAKHGVNIVGLLY